MRARWGTTGVLEALSAAVALRQPVYVYPVADLDTEAPVGWTSSMGVGGGGSGSAGAGMGGADGTSHVPRLRDCIPLKPGSRVEDVYDALKRGALPHVTVQGDFVRAEGRGLDTAAHKKKQIGREAVIDDTCAVLRIQTNRKSVWQHAAAVAAND